MSEIGTLTAVQRAGADALTQLGAGVHTRVFFSAGEASGDAYAAELASRIGEARPDVDLEGVGGQLSQGAGVHLVASSQDWGAVGIIESLKVVPQVWQGYRAALVHLRRGRPGLFVPIDYGYLNIKLCRQARARGWRVVYFIPPGSWRRTKQGADLPGLTDAIITPFSWSATMLQEMGANAHWFGHPLRQMLKQVDAPAVRSGIAVLPGSRHHEIEHNLRAIAPALQGLNVPIRLAPAPNVTSDEVTQAWGRAGGGECEVVRPARAALMASRAAVVCSGTATLEAALALTPTVVTYRGPWTMELEYRIRKPKFDFISLPNILLQRGALPELIQNDATPEAIRAALLPLLDDGPERAAQLAAMKEVQDFCGPSDALDQSAKMILAWLAPPLEPSPSS